MKTYEIKWKPSNDMYATMQTDVVEANDLSEAKRIIESKVSSTGSGSIEWYSNRIIAY